MNKREREWKLERNEIVVIMIVWDQNKISANLSLF